SGITVSLLAPADLELMGAGPPAAFIPLAGTGDLAVLLERHAQGMNVAVLARVEIGSAIEDKEELVGAGCCTIELQVGLVPEVAVVRHPQIIAIKMIDGGHLVAGAHG